MPILDTPFARLELQRQPPRRDDPLQAFDAADEYLLQHLHAQGLPAQARVLVLNDAFGALACALASHATVVSSGDSHLGWLALQDNLQRNGLAADAVAFVPASAVAEVRSKVRVTAASGTTLPQPESDAYRLQVELDAASGANEVRF
ncbi:50S rRNA methyltransferase, partial [Azotobacter chroococcum]|nr:50S rRNA methyltransferase [Azotobacter chroococcum]